MDKPINPLRAFIIDDQINDINDIKSKILKLNPEVKIEQCLNPYEAIEILNTGKFDVIFLDIQMPGITGIDIAESYISDETPIVVCSSYPEYAVDTAKYRPFEYLLKPISVQKLKYALHKVKKHLLNHQDKIKLQFQTGKSKSVNCRVSDIRYFEAWGDYQKMHTDKKSHLIIETLDDLTKKMNPYNFIRIHRKYLVNANYISEINPKSIKIQETELPIGRSYKKNISREYT